MGNPAFFLLFIEHDRLLVKSVSAFKFFLFSFRMRIYDVTIYVYFGWIYAQVEKDYRDY